MTAKQYRAAIAKLGLSQRAAAKLLGVNERTSRRYAENGAPESITRLLAMCIRYGIPKIQLEEWRSIAKGHPK